MNLRVAFCGASGTGKTTLAKYIQEKYAVDFNPVGSRSVAAEMGFDNPYDVDKAGKRAEFQHRLLRSKLAWEAERDSFVTDRTTLDNLSYTVLHDVYAVDAETLALAKQGWSRYTHVFYCSPRDFINLGGDDNRVDSFVYHELFDTVLQGLFQGLSEENIAGWAPVSPPPIFFRLESSVLTSRKWEVDEILGKFLSGREAGV